MINHDLAFLKQTLTILIELSRYLVKSTMSVVVKFDFKILFASQKVYVSDLFSDCNINKYSNFESALLSSK